jgi:alpha-mannosidase
MVITMSDLKPRIYTVATAHLDTSWNWDFETTLREYIPATLRDNFALFEKYPDYRFSFEGSYRYELMEEYYPEEFEKLKEYVAQGRWNVTGSAYENGDVNIPSPEALFRNILYGNSYFDKTFGKRSTDIFLPDCFGFGWALPSIARHANLSGFTTQKLTWSSAFGIPFDLGRWYGVDGRWIYASLDARSYVAELDKVRKNRAVSQKLKANLKKYNLPFTYIFHGTGDCGGAPKEESVATVCQELSENKTEKSDVLSAPADQVFRDMEAELTPEQKASLPFWNTELVSTDHGVGSYTSRAIGKRWNRRAEQLADAAERSASAAMWLGAADYPQEKMDTAWKRIIAHQFHDDLTGTSLMRCYQRNWNDYILSLNELAEEYRASVGAVSTLMDTSFVKGTALLVNNPLQGSENRIGPVTAFIPVSENCQYLRVYDLNGSEVPAQVLSRNGEALKIVFIASVPSMGYAVYDVRESGEPCPIQTRLRAQEKLLENERYRLTLDHNGDISSIYDKEVGMDLLTAPIRMGVHHYLGSTHWPAWELDFVEVMTKPIAYARAPKFTILENGPARVAIETLRVCGPSTFRQVISLSAGGDTVEVYNEIEWRNMRSLLKTQFPLAVSNPKASYDLGLGVIERGNNTPKLYEVPAQMWADITKVDGSCGVSILSDSKYGWDKPLDNCLRLTGIHTPQSAYRDESGQNTMDLGLNRYSFGIFGHMGGYENGTQMAAARFNQPMNAFLVEKHPGALGREFSFGRISEENTLVRALKKAQDSDEIIIRFNEGAGKTHTKLRFELGAGIASAREIYASEEPREEGEFLLEGGVLQFDLKAFEPRSFALTLAPAPVCGQLKHSMPIELPYDTDLLSFNRNRADCGTACPVALPAERFPSEIRCGGVRFVTGPKEDLAANAVICRGQKLSIPEGAKYLSLMMASLSGDRRTALTIGKTGFLFTVHDLLEAVGKWDLYGMQETGQIKQTVLAWNATHLHRGDADSYGEQAYFFKYTFEIPAGAKSFTLPLDQNLLLLAASGTDLPACRTAAPLYDTLKKREFDFWITEKDRRLAHPGMLSKAAGFLKFGGSYVSRSLQREIDLL